MKIERKKNRNKSRADSRPGVYSTQFKRRGNYKFPRAQILNRSNGKRPTPSHSLFRAQSPITRATFLWRVRYSRRVCFFGNIVTVTTPLEYTKKGTICRPSYGTGRRFVRACVCVCIMYTVGEWVAGMGRGEMVISAVDVVAGDFFSLFSFSQPNGAEMRICLERKSVFRNNKKKSIRRTRNIILPGYGNGKRWSTGFTSA